MLRAEIDSTGLNRINEYVTGPYGGAAIARTTGSGAGTIHNLVEDARGNVSGQFNGTTLEQDLVYGRLGSLASVGTTTGDTVRLQWKGYYWEGDSTQLYYARARWYDPINGRFVSEDPAGEGFNPYEFAGGDQANGQDPSGAEEDCGDDSGDGCTGGGGDGPAIFVLPPDEIDGWQSTFRWWGAMYLANAANGLALQNQMSATFGMQNALLAGANGASTFGVGSALHVQTSVDSHRGDCQQDAIATALTRVPAAAVAGGVAGAIEGNGVALAVGVRTGAVAGIVAGAATVEVGGTGAVPAFALGFVGGYAKSELRSILTGALSGAGAVLADGVINALACPKDAF